MSIMFRTPELLSDITKQSHYDEVDNYHDESIEVQKTEVKLLKTLNRMVEEGVPLSQTQLMRRTGTTSGTVGYYDYIFKDVIDMLCLFYPASPTKTSRNPRFQEAKALMDKHDIHDFETLEKKVIEAIFGPIINGNDELALLADDLCEKGVVNEIFRKKAFEPLDAMFSFLGQRFIHPDFESLDINEMGKKVYEKYLKVQELKAEYDRLKAE